MPYFKAEMHQIRFRLGLCPRPRWSSLQLTATYSPDPLAGFKRPTSKGGWVAEWLACWTQAQKARGPIYKISYDLS